MPHLVIVAGGLGSRLAPLTNHIPKFLVNTGKNTGYVEMLRYWRRNLELFPDASTDTLTVIVHPDYAELTKEYHKLYFPSVPLTIKTVSVANGSAHAILSTCDHLVGQPVIFSWCDIIPVDDLPFSELIETYHGDSVVFTNYNNSNRYGLVREGTSWAHVVPKLNEHERGGCFGLYYVSRFHTNVMYNDGEDFIDVLRQYGPIREHRLDQIIDFGDLPKLERTRAKADESREFNSLTFVGDYVLKESSNEQGRSIIAKEIHWYSELAKHHEQEIVKATINGQPWPEELPVPKVWLAPDNSGLFMSKVEGMPIWKAWPQLSPVDRAYVLQQVVDGGQRLFDLNKGPVSLDVVERDVTSEARIKLLDRYDEIKGVIDAFGPIKEVNGFCLSEHDPRVTIDRLFNMIIAHYKKLPELEYGFIHGDLQLSNSMVDLATMRVTIIDPRGYFGKSSCAGLRDYDIAKLMYSLDGYDLFNYAKDFSIRLQRDAQRISFDIPRLDKAGSEQFYKQLQPIHQLWLAVIWIGLAQYIKNDPIKSVAAHYHGLAKAEQVMHWLAS